MITHLSPSTAQSYKKCSKAVYFQKVLGIPNETGYAATGFGSAMHEAIEKLFRNKMQETKITLDEFRAKFRDAYAQYSQKTTVWKEDSVEHLLEQGNLACEGFYKYWYDRFEPEAVERRFVIDRGEGNLPIVTIADLITKDGKIIDWKFGRSSRPGEYILNMATYAKCYLIEYGCLPEEVVIVSCKWSRRKQENGKYKHFFAGYQSTILPVTMDWIKYADSVYADVENGIKQGVWVTAADGNGLCKECWYRKIGKCNVVLLEGKA